MSDPNFTLPIGPAALRLGVTADAVRRLVAQRRLPGDFRNGRWYTSPEAVERLVIRRAGALSARSPS